MRSSGIVFFLSFLSPAVSWRLWITGQSHPETTIEAIQPNVLSTLFPPALRSNNVCEKGFSNFEGWAQDPDAEHPHRRVILHPIAFEALERLTAQGLSVWSLANNHAFDGGIEGLEGTRAAMRRVHANFAGTGVDAQSAAAFTMLPCEAIPTAFVSVASGGVDSQIASQAQAQDSRPGINMITLTEETNEPNPVDLERVLESVRAARRAVGPKGVVLFSHHNHLVFWNLTFTPLYRAGDPRASQVPAWIFPFVEAVLDAGASVYLGHGNPVFQGAAVVKGKPVFYGLGSFVFHPTVNNQNTFGPFAWESIVADMRIVGKDNWHIRVKVLEMIQDRGHVDWGLPLFPNTTNGQRILDRFVALSAAFGTQLTVDSERTVATLQLKIAEERVPKVAKEPKRTKGNRAPVAIGVGAGVVLLIGGAGVRRRQLLQAKATTSEVKPAAQTESISVQV